LKAQELRDRVLIGRIGEDLQHLEQADMQIRILDSRIADQNENLKLARQLYDKARTEDEMDRTKVTAVVQTANATIPEKPIAPNKLLFMVGGTLIGLICACGVVVFAVITNRSFLSDEAVERALGLPVLGSVPIHEANRQWLV